MIEMIRDAIMVNGWTASNIAYFVGALVLIAIVLALAAPRQRDYGHARPKSRYWDGER